jgi:putative transposase
MTQQPLKTASHAAFRIRYHLVFVIKYRHPVLTAQMLERLQEVFSHVATKWRCELIEFGGESDHVHLLVEAHPSMDLSRFAGNLKTVSARRMRNEFSDHLRTYFWKPYFWSRSYAVLSVGTGAPLQTLIEYVRAQERPDASLTRD